MKNVEIESHLAKTELLTKKQVVRILQRALPRRSLRSFELLTGGLSNTNYRLLIDGAEASLVLRVYSRDPAACQKEVDTHRLVMGQVPVPEIIYASPEGEGDIGPYVVMQWIEGQTFRQIKSRREPAEIATAAYSIGAILARIGSFTFPDSGPNDAGLIVGAPTLIDENSISRSIEARLASLPDQRLTSTQQDHLRGFIWRWAPRLSTLNNEHSLVHSDFSSTNIILRDDKGDWKVVGVLDWEFATSGSPLTDIGSILRYDRLSHPLMEPHFSAGFRNNGGILPENWRELARVVDLMNLCNGLAQPMLASPIIAEMVELITATIDGRDPKLHMR